MIGNALVYGYSNSRVHALKAQLVDSGRLERMIRADSVASATTVLAETAYAAELTELALEHKGAELVEYAISRHFSKVCKKVLKMTPAAHQPVVEGLLSKWDIQDIKTILLGMHRGRQPQEYKGRLTYAGSLSTAEMEGIIQSESVVNAVRHLGDSVYGKALAPQIAEYERAGDIIPLLARLDGVYMRRLDEADDEVDDRMLKSLMETDLDARNIMTIIRCKADGSIDDETIASLVSPSVKLGPQQLEELIKSKNWRVTVARLGGYDLKDAAEAYDRDQSLTHFENALQELVLKHALRTFHTAVLSLGPVVAFLYIKEEEMRRIRRIIHGKEFNTPAETIREEVFRVVI